MNSLGDSAGGGRLDQTEIFYERPKLEIWEIEDLRLPPTPEEEAASSPGKGHTAISHCDVYIPPATFTLQLPVSMLYVVFLESHTRSIIFFV